MGAVPIFLQSEKRGTVPTRALLLVVHGLAEYGDRYRPLADPFAAAGISLVAFDQRGHGRGANPPTHVDRFDDYVADLNEVVSTLHARHPRLPIFLWGHSMGSIVVLLAAQRLHPAVRGIITSSNSLEIFRRGTNPRNPFFRLLSRIVPQKRVPLGLDSRKISSDLDVQKSYAADPLIPATASLRLIVEFASACEQARRVAASIRLPALTLHGEEDAIAPAEGSRVLHGLLGSKDKQLEIYPGMRHEVHNEVAEGRSRFIQRVADWILERA